MIRFCVLSVPGCASAQRNASRIWRLMWQTPRFCYLAEPCKHPFVLFGGLLVFCRRGYVGPCRSGDKKRQHLCVGAWLIEGNRVENVVSILLQEPSPPERIIAGSSNKSVEAIRAFSRHFKALVSI